MKCLPHPGNKFWLLGIQSYGAPVSLQLANEKTSCATWELEEKRLCLIHERHRISSVSTSTAGGVSWLNREI